MYKIQTARHGFTLTFAGTLYSEELRHWLEESERALAKCTEPFGVIVDMRNSLPLGPEVHALILQGQQLYKESRPDALGRHSEKLFHRQAIPATCQRLSDLQK